MKLLSALLIMFAATLCLAEESAPIIPGYKENIISEVKLADQIEIIEHSHFLDFDSKGKSDLKSKKEIIYSRIKLKPSQVEALLAQLNKFEFIDSSSLCMFEPHHRIEFSKNGKNISSIEICFQCQDIEWSKDNITRGMLSEAFSSTVLSLGMKTERDWRELAKEKMNQDEHGQ